MVMPWTPGSSCFADLCGVLSANRFLGLQDRKFDAETLQFVGLRVFEALVVAGVDDRADGHLDQRRAASGHAAAPLAVLIDRGEDCVAFFLGQSGGQILGRVAGLIRNVLIEGFACDLQKRLLFGGAQADQHTRSRRRSDGGGGGGLRSGVLLFLAGRAQAQGQNQRQKQAGGRDDVYAFVILQSGLSGPFYGVVRTAFQSSSPKCASSR